MRKIRTYVQAVFAAAAIAAVAAGCSQASGTQTSAAGTESAAGQSSAADSTTTAAAGETTAAAADGATEHLTIATSGSPNPFSYVKEDGTPTGYDVELIKAVLDRLPQYTYDVEVADFPSIFGGLTADKYQIGVNNFSYNEERAQKFLYTTASFKNSYVIAVAKDNTDINSLDDLVGKKTEVSASTTYATALQDFNEEHKDKPINISYYDNVALVEVLRHVENGAFDFQIIDEPMFDNYMKEFNLNLKAVKLNEEDTNKITTPYSYFLVGQKHEKLKEEINQELAEMVKDGSIKKISEEFFNGSDYTPYDQYETK